MSQADAAALVLSEENATSLGYVGVGPFTFPGVFPGTFVVGEPLRVTELGFVTEDEARAAFNEAFADSDVPLEWTTVSGDEGYAVKENHAQGEAEARAAQAEEVRAAIRTHADADQAAADAGMPPFAEDPRPTVAEKVAAIESFKAAAPLEPQLPDEEEEG